MKFRLGIESLESRENPSGPSLLDPTGSQISPDNTTPPADTTTPPTDTTTTPTIDPSLLVNPNPWGS